MKDLLTHEVTKAARASIKHQKPAILWFTGLSGAGKSTAANLVEARLLERRAHTILLDGDHLRLGLNKDLGFTEADRTENIRRVGEVAKLMVEAGLIVLCCFISPFAAQRRFVRELVEDGEFIEIFLDAPLEVCIARDPKGLYRRALTGEIKDFTGIGQVLRAAGAARASLSDAPLLAGRNRRRDSALSLREEDPRRSVTAKNPDLGERPIARRLWRRRLGQGR